MKIMLWDIEATNLQAEMGRVLCVGIGEISSPMEKIKKVHVIKKLSKCPSDDTQVVKEAADILRTADVWVTYYGKRYDVPMMQSRLLAASAPFLPSIPHVDLYFTPRFQLKLRSNRLANIQKFMGLPTQKTDIDWETWIKAGAGEKKALDYVVDHCAKDVLVLGQAYQKLLPLIRQHPNMAVFFDSTRPQCVTCGADALSKNGTRISAGKIKQRWVCEKCASYTVLPIKK